MGFVHAFAMGFGHLVSLGAVALLAVRDRVSRRGTLVVVLLFSAYVALQVSLFIVQRKLLPGLRFPWLGKLTTTALVLCASLAGVGPSLRRMGVRRPRAGSWPKSSVLIVACVVVSFFDASIPGRPGLERTLFEATMPGLDEELFMRGLLLALLNRSRRFTFWGIPTDASVAWITVIFTWGHVFGVDASFRPHLDSNIASLVSLVGFSVCCTLLRQWSGSVWPAVLAHNVANTGLVVLAAWTNR